MAVGVGINNLGNTSVANTNDLFIIGEYSSYEDGQGNIIVSYDTKGITYSNLRSNLDFVDLDDLSVTEVAAVDGTDTSLEYDANTGVFTYTKPYLLSNTEIRSLITAEDAKITVTNGVIGLGSVSTTDISEGNKLFYTTSRATADARAALTVSGSLVYNSYAGTLSYTERTDDEIRDLFSGALGVTFDDNSGEISIGQDVSTSADVTFGDITADSFTAGGATVYNNTIKLSNSNTNDNWVGVIDQASASDQQRLIIGSGDGLTGTGVVPQGAYTAWYGPSDVNYPSQIRNVVRDGSTQKTAGGFYSNGQMWAAFGASITGDLEISGTVTATIDGSASEVESISNFSTSDLSEGTNLYFTNARAVSALSGATTSDIAEGTRLYFTNGRVTSVIESTSINTLSDVDTTTALVDGAILSWNSSTAKWESVSSKDNMPIGTVQWYAGTSSNVPAGWLECDGTAVTSTYPTLRQFLIDSGSPFGTSGGNPKLPDLRGRFARGYDPSGTNTPYATTVGMFQDDAVERHRHDSGTLEASSAGNHNHYTGLNPDNTNAFTFGGTSSGTASARVDHNGGNNRYNPLTSNAGEHTHDISGQTADWPAMDTPGMETRPKNISFIPIIKAWGTLLNSSNLGVADIANLLNNIATQSEAEVGANNTKFMSPLRTLQAIDERFEDKTNWVRYESNVIPERGFIWGGSAESSLTNYRFKRTNVIATQMRNCNVNGLKIGGDYRHIWIDVGYYLYNFAPGSPMTWDHYPTSYTVQFEITQATLGFAVGDRITVPTNNDHKGADEGFSQFFRLVNVDGVNRLRLYLYCHNNLGHITGFGQQGVLGESKGHFVVNMTKQGPTF